jgi:tetratricopeptide (TPR) repeat protein
MNSECRIRFYYPAFLSVLLAALFAFTGCSNAEKAKAEHVAKGDAYLKEQKFQEASIEYRNAIQIDDSMAAAHWGLAQAYEGLQRFQEAIEELRKTASLDPNHLEARIKLGNYYIAGSKGRSDIIAEAEKLAQEILQKDANNIEGHILLGSVLFAQGDRDKAFGELNHAISIDPKRVESYLSLARFYIVTNDKANAESTYQRAIAVNGNSGLAHTEYGKFLVQANRNDEAEVELKKAVELEPKNFQSRFYLASFYLAFKQFDKAEEAYKALVAIDPDKPENQAVLADFYASVNRIDDSIKTYQDILAKHPDFNPARYRLGEILLARGDYQGTLAQAEELLKKDSHDRQALLLRARIRMQTGQPDNQKAAIEDLKEVLRQEPDSRAGLYFMAQATYTVGQLEQARTFAADLERKYPEYLPGKLMQAQITLGGGDPKTAVRLGSDLIDKVNKATPDALNSPQLLAEIKTKAYLTRGAANAQLGNLSAARLDFTAAKETAPNLPEVYVNLANLAKVEGKPQDAVTFYENALSIDETNGGALAGLVDLYGRTKETAKAHARLDQVLNKYPNNASLHFLKGQAFGYEHNPQGAEAELRKTLELDPNYLPAYSALGALFVNTKQEDRAIAEYRKILELRPDNATAYTLIGMLEDGRRNFVAAADNYRKALEKDPNAIIAANNLAWLYATRRELNGNMDEAVRLAQGVVQKNPNVAGFVDTLGWVYYQKGLHAAAVDQLQKAVKVDEENARVTNTVPSPNYHYHLGVALKAKGDRVAAKRELETAIRLAEKVPLQDIDEARKALSEL